MSLYISSTVKIHESQVPKLYRSDSFQCSYRNTSKADQNSKPRPHMARIPAASPTINAATVESLIQETLDVIEDLYQLREHLSSTFKPCGAISPSQPQSQPVPRGCKEACSKGRVVNTTTDTRQHVAALSPRYRRPTSSVYEAECPPTTEPVKPAPSMPTKSPPAIPLKSPLRRISSMSCSSKKSDYVWESTSPHCDKRSCPSLETLETKSERKRQKRQSRGPMGWMYSVKDALATPR